MAGKESVPPASNSAAGFSPVRGTQLGMRANAIRSQTLWPVICQFALLVAAKRPTNFFKNNKNAISLKTCHGVPFWYGMCLSPASTNHQIHRQLARGPVTNWALVHIKIQEAYIAENKKGANNMLNKDNENGALPMEDKDLVKVAGGTEGEVQMTAQIIRERCCAGNCSAFQDGNIAPCVELCPTGAIRRISDYAVVDSDLCINCNLCCGVCPFDAISLAW